MCISFNGLRFAPGRNRNRQVPPGTPPGTSHPKRRASSCVIQDSLTISIQRWPTRDNFAHSTVCNVFIARLAEELEDSWELVSKVSAWNFHWSRLCEKWASMSRSPYRLWPSLHFLRAETSWARLIPEPERLLPSHCPCFRK